MNPLNPCPLQTPCVGLRPLAPSRARARVKGRSQGINKDLNPQGVVTKTSPLPRTPPAPPVLEAQRSAHARRAPHRGPEGLRLPPIEGGERASARSARPYFVFGRPAEAGRDNFSVSVWDARTHQRMYVLLYLLHTPTHPHSSTPLHRLCTVLQHTTPHSTTHST